MIEKQTEKCSEINTLSFSNLDDTSNSFFLKNKKIPGAEDIFNRQKEENGCLKKEKEKSFLAIQEEFNKILCESLIQTYYEGVGIEEIWGHSFGEYFAKLVINYGISENINIIPQLWEQKGEIFIDIPDLFYFSSYEEDFSEFFSKKGDSSSYQSLGNSLYMKNISISSKLKKDLQKDEFFPLIKDLIINNIAKYFIENSNKDIDPKVFIQNLPQKVGAYIMRDLIKENKDIGIDFLKNNKKISLIAFSLTLGSYASIIGEDKFKKILEGLTDSGIKLSSNINGFNINLSYTRKDEEKLFRIGIKKEF